MRFLFVTILFFLLAGCAQPKPKKVDRVKSCEALIYEAKKIEERLINDKKIVEELNNREIPLHIFVIALGTVISLQPQAIASSHFYVAPALTISYYNLFAAADDILYEYDYFEDRKIVINRLIEDKNCNNQN